MAFTNNYHGLIWREIIIPENMTNPIAVYRHGIFFYVFTLYVYSLIFLGTFWLIKKLTMFPREKRSQVLILIVSVAIGWTANIVYIAGLSPIRGFDLTPISFVFISLVLTWFIYRKQLFDLVPIARGILVDNMTDGVLVLGDDGRVVDFNQAAIDITRYNGRSPVGMSIWEMYKDYLPQISHLRDQTDMQVELELPSNPPRYLDVKIDSIGERKD
ncbi:MAG: PAS domain-containing protein [Chloroflexi bacterium]|nr:PAS domain-containing protein [Chloroflexota bacterium]